MKRRKTEAVDRGDDVEMVPMMGSGDQTSGDITIQVDPKKDECQSASKEEAANSDICGCNCLKSCLKKIRKTAECAWFFTFSVLLPFGDVFSDFVAGVGYLHEGRKLYGWLTLLVMLLPILLSIVARVFNYFIRKINKNRSCCQIDKDVYWHMLSYLKLAKHLPFGQAISNFRVFVALACMDTTKPYNWLLKAKLKSMADEVSATEAFLESGPQLMLQINIVLSTGEIGWKQAVCIGLSLISLIFGSLAQFFLGRVGNGVDDNPQWRFYVCVLPFVATDILCSILAASLILLLYPIKGLWIPLIIVSLNWVLILLMKYSNRLSDNLDELQNENNAEHISKLKDEIPKKIYLSAITSWISNSVVVENSTKLQLVAASIAVGAYASGLTYFIQNEMFLPRTKLEDYSMVACAPSNYSDAFETSYLDVNETLLFSGRIPGLKLNTGQVIRKCKDGESSLDLLNDIINILITAVILKAISDAVLNIFADYSNLIRFLRFFRHRTFHHITEINRKRYSQKRLPMCLLRKKIDLLNRQDPSNGKTMMHTLAKESYGFPWENFVELHRRGGKVDILDFSDSNAIQFLTPKKVKQIKECPTTNKSGKPKKKDTLHNLLNDKEWDILFGCILVGAKPSTWNVSGETFIKTLVDGYLENAVEESIFLYLASAFSLEDFFLLLNHMIKTCADKANLENILLTYKMRNIQPRCRCLYTCSCLPRCCSFCQGCCSFCQGCCSFCQGCCCSFCQGCMGRLYFWCFRLVKYFETRIEDPDFKMQTPIHLAARMGLHQILKDILKVYPYPNVKSAALKTPLHEVFEGLNGILNKRMELAEVNSTFDFKECIQALLRERADLNSKDINGRTPIHLACEYPNSSAEFLEMLLNSQLPFEIDIKDDKGMTSLHYACKAGNTDCAKVLIEKNANLSEASKTSVTPLHLASSFEGNSDCVKLLLSEGKNRQAIEQLTKAKDDKGMTPLHYACRVGNEENVKALLEDDVDQNLRAKNGDTPLDLAQKSGFHTIVEIINSKVNRHQ